MMGNSTNDLRRRAERVFRDAGVTVKDSHGHRGHIVFELERDGQHWKHGIPGSPSSVEHTLTELRQNIRRRLKSPP
jgi:hypothetical protein